MKKITKTIIPIAIVAFGIILMNVAPAKADSMTVDNMPDISAILSSLMDTTMQSMGMNPTSMKDMMEQMNVATNKKEVPTASVTFSPSDPKEGDDVNAMARFTGFKNPKEGLYFTWFIKHDAKCPDDHSLCGYRSDNPDKPRECNKGNCD